MVSAARVVARCDNVWAGDRHVVGRVHLRGAVNSQAYLAGQERVRADRSHLQVVRHSRRNYLGWVQTFAVLRHDYLTVCPQVRMQIRREIRWPRADGEEPSPEAPCDGSRSAHQRRCGA